MTHVLRLMKSIACEFGVAFLMTSHTVSSFAAGESKSGAGAGSAAGSGSGSAAGSADKPSLGESWTYAADLRLSLSFTSASAAGDGKSDAGSGSGSGSGSAAASAAKAGDSRKVCKAIVSKSGRTVLPPCHRLVLLCSSPTDVLFLLC